MEDLVVLVADKQMEFTIRGLLERYHALEIRRVSHSIYRHPNSDPGCRAEAHTFLRSFHASFHHALVLFDHHGCGRPNVAARELEQDVERRLARNGWQDRARCVVIDPELEVWVWSESPEVENCLGWQYQTTRLRDWLEQQGLWEPNEAKPMEPKETLERALREIRRPRSAALFRDLATSVSVRRCSDSSFVRLRHILQAWFPVSQGESYE